MKFRELNVEIVLLATVFFVLLATLITAAHFGLGNETTTAIVSWGGMVIAGLLALVRGSSNKGDPPSGNAQP